MIELVTALEAIGSLLVLAGMVGIRYKTPVGPAMMMVGGLVLSIWAFQIGAWYILGLNAGAALINSWTLYHWSKEDG